MRPSQQVRELATAVPGVTTDELLHKLLANLVTLLGARRAYVTEMLDEQISHTIACWEDGQRGPEREYSITGTPCEAVMRYGVYVVDRELGERYSLSESSLGFGFESFIGGPILNRHGTTIGQLCVFSDNQVADREMAGALVSLAAVRVSAELEHRQQQASLLRQRRQLEILLGNLPGMAYRCDYNQLRRMHFVSEGCAALTGYASEELLGESYHWSGLIHEDDRDRVWHEVQSALSAGSNFEVQYRIFTKDSRQKWAWERGCGVAGEDGQISALEGFISDATALKESEEALARSEAYSTAIVATAADGIITLDAEGRIGSFNRAAERMFGYEAVELMGQNVHVLMPEPYRSEHDAYIRRYIATGNTKVIGKVREVTAQRKDGSRFPIQLGVSEVLLDGERCFAGIIRDISDQKAAEEEARHHRERIAHISRLSTLGEMAAGIAHEINQPLTAISLFAQAGKRLVDAGNFTKVDEVLDKLNEHALRASAVIERMQAMARRGETVKEVADCNAAIESAVKFAESEARIHDIQIELEMDDDLPPVFIDAVQVQQVALNLLRNGMEAMVAADDSNGRSVNVQTRVRDSGDIEVAVIDTGCGVREENVDKLFTPFSTTKKSGMGMGLSISQAIIRAHGGQLDFHNNDTGGATFWFTLPAATREIRDG